MLTAHQLQPSNPWWLGTRSTRYLAALPVTVENDATGRDSALTQWIEQWDRTPTTKPVLIDTGQHGRRVYLPYLFHHYLTAVGWAEKTGVLDIHCNEPVIQRISRWLIQQTKPDDLLQDQAYGLWMIVTALECARWASDRSTPVERDIWQQQLEEFKQLIDAQLARCAVVDHLHPHHPEESLDTWTYTELVGLHALACAQALLPNANWAERIQSVVNYQFHNTQPDNVTTQPWAAFVFFKSAEDASFAEQQIHDATVQGHSLLNTMLLAETAWRLGVSSSPSTK